MSHRSQRFVNGVPRLPWVVGIVILLVAGPWGLLLFSGIRARDIALVAHYQALILGLIALAAAVMGLISYLTVEQRVQARMASYYREIKEENKTRLRELITLERILDDQDTDAFEEFIAEAVDEVQMWEFFQGDIEDGFMDMMWSMRSLSKTCLVILTFLQRHPEFEIGDHWRFYLYAMSETTEYLSAR